MTDVKKKRCHPEAGKARRGTSQALYRFREIFNVFVISAAADCSVPKIANARSLGALCQPRDDIPSLLK
jgi:hypothetical protein